MNASLFLPCRALPGAVDLLSVPSLGPESDGGAGRHGGEVLDDG